MEQQLKILITGGTGFVGSSIVEVFVNTGRFKLICLQREASKEFYKIDKNLHLETIDGDITSYKTLQSLESQAPIDVVIHSAGLAHQFGKTEKEKFWRVNVEGTANICKLSQKLKVKHLILI